VPPIIAELCKGPIYVGDTVVVSALIGVALSRRITSDLAHVDSISILHVRVPPIQGE
jgi:hypothetical protein